ncbi:MAG: hypothetical protein M1380_03775 [Chloroflexi bacterium]|nr:hypothetical protein [Chloroflexota bacterium]
MLRQLRQRASEALSNAPQIVLSAYGPAEIQAETLPCEAVDLVLYVLVARTSDLLFNLESNALVVATANTWQVRGVARLLRPGEYPGRLALARTPEAAWCQVVEIRPTRLQLRPPHGQGQGETIDLW